jgi:murein DD-endopeptidase MepM/ murein hydrolase activator NlpD
MAIKQWLVKIVCFLVRAGIKFFNWLFLKFGFCRKIGALISAIIFKGLVFPIYKFGHYLKYRFLNIYSPAKSKFFYILNKNYFVYFVLALLGSVIVVNNIKAEELREENFGEQTIIYSVISDEESEELTEETGIVAPDEGILSYLDKSWSVENQKIPVSPQADEAEQFATEFSTVTEGGTAVVKPNIIEPVNMGEVAVGTSGSSVVTYIVQEGETVSSIAQKFNISAETILWQNGLGPKSPLKIGDKLEILPVSGVTHSVKRGETVSSIAKKYNIEEDKIIGANNLFDGHDIQISQKLIIPGGKKISPYAAKPKYTATVNVPQVAPISKLFIPPSQIVSGSGMLWPTSVRRITQYFNWRHSAIDIAGPKGTPLYAAEDGTVTFSGWLKGYGYNVYIDHGNGVMTRYGHASKLYVEKGDAVVKGQTIAAMGSTGWSTGSHLHFEVVIAGVRKNPLSYVK